MTPDVDSGKGRTQSDVIFCIFIPIFKMFFLIPTNSREKVIKKHTPQATMHKASLVEILSFIYNYYDLRIPK